MSLSNIHKHVIPALATTFEKLVFAEVVESSQEFTEDMWHKLDSQFCIDIKEPQPFTLSFLCSSAWGKELASLITNTPSETIDDDFYKDTVNELLSIFAGELLRQFVNSDFHFAIPYHREQRSPYEDLKKNYQLYAYNVNENCLFLAIKP